MVLSEESCDYSDRGFDAVLAGLNTIKMGKGFNNANCPVEA